MLVISGRNGRDTKGNCHAVAGSKVCKLRSKLVPFLSPFSSSFPPFLFPPITPYYYTPKSPPFSLSKPPKETASRLILLMILLMEMILILLLILLMLLFIDFIITFDINFVIDKVNDIICT